MQKNLIIVQARLASSRLPYKALKLIRGRPLLSYTFERLKALKTPCEVILATTNNAEDDALEKLATAYSLRTFRGSECNVLERFYRAAEYFKGDIITRITGDCPLVEVSLLDKMLYFFKSKFGEYDYISNVLIRSYPKGIDLELFTMKALNQAYLSAETSYQKEHVTPYFYQHPQKFQLYNFKMEEDLSEINLSVDTLEDFQRVEKLIEALYSKHPLFGLNQMRKLLLELKSQKA